MTAAALHELRLMAAALALPVIVTVGLVVGLWLLYRLDALPEDER